MTEFSRAPGTTVLMTRSLTKWTITRDEDNPENITGEVESHAVCEPDEFDHEEGLDAVALAVDVCKRSGAIEPSCMPWGGNLHSVWIGCESYTHPHQGYVEDYSIHFNSNWSTDEKAQVLRVLFPQWEH